MVLTMVYNTELLGFWTYSIVWYLENTTFRKLDLFPSSDEGAGEDTYSVGPLRKNNWVGVFSPTFTWGRKQIQFPKRRVLYNTRRWKKPQNPVILCTCILFHSYASSETQQQCARLFHLLAVKPEMRIKIAALPSNQETESTHLPLTSHSSLFPHRWAKQFSHVF
jgi:hypothetical protein